MKIKDVIVLTMLAIILFASTEGWASCDKRDPLFKIERSKNKHIVQYDACLLKDNNISDSDPVDAYWILANGQKEELNVLESKQAYGIESKEKLGENKFRILLAALKEREIIIQKMKGDYKALVRINGKLSILERVYVKSEEQALGLPKVHYIDLSGRILQTSRPVKERITPK
jgi:hypothetical protein